MKTHLKVVSLVIVFVMILSCSVFAAAPTIQLDKPTTDKEEKEAVVSGKVSNPVADTQVTILVIDSSLSNMTDSNIAYVNQIPVEEDGTFAFSLAINQDNFSGDSFTAYVGGTEVATVKNTPLYFGNKPGDVSGDGKVTMLDYQMVVTNFGKITSVGDASGDGKVSMLDYQLVVTNFGK